MQIDRYLKLVLTVIAVTLTVVVAGQLAPGSALLGGCGSSPTNPCFVRTQTVVDNINAGIGMTARALPVLVTNPEDLR